MKENGLLCFHQGWADIFNSLALINHYLKEYKKIYLIMRDDCVDIVEFYIKNLNVCVFYVSKGTFSTLWNLDKFALPKNIDLLFIGLYDGFRNDQYKDKYKIIYNNNKYDFCQAFYESYNIPYITRIEGFNITRNKELENEKYSNFIDKTGEKYILFHEIIDYNLVTTKENVKFININRMSDIYFDTIKILENSIELHLLDSSWASFIYLLDCKYQLFKDKKIFLYTKRKLYKLFTEPLKLDNWIFVS
tara:strand:+ start:2881 stop:3624 length:744 start_codon:yes stop_codon:yes gene_type:complete